ncbi:MAG: acyltransferase [Candidatus Coprovivens sp.]
MTKERNSNIEIIRIISMVMIVVSHWTVHSGILQIDTNLLFNKILISNTVLGNIGVILFFLISGYFGYKKSDSIKINVKKILKIVLQVIFYSVFLYFICTFYDKNILCLTNIIKAFMPITFKEYWYVTVYIVLLLLSPFINLFIDNLKGKSNNYFIYVTTILFFIFPTLTKQDFYGNELIQAIYFYFLGSYIKNNDLKIFDKHAGKIALFSYLMLVLQSVFFVVVCNYFSIQKNYALHLYERNSILSVIFCFSLFYYFTRKQEKSNKIINIIASNVFAVYLISDNNYLRSIIWNKLFNVSSYINSYYLILNLIISVLFIFIICIIIEILRKMTIEKIVDKVIAKIKY